MSDVMVAGVFDDLHFADYRFLQEAAKLGRVVAAMWSDDFLAKQSNADRPKFPQAEREYLLRANRYVNEVSLIERNLLHWIVSRRTSNPEPSVWAIRERHVWLAENFYSTSIHLDTHVIPEELLRQAAPVPPVAVNPPAKSPTGKKVIATGCFDYFHSGHVRFAEECSQLGDLYVSVGNDENVRQLKGAGHPLFPAAERAFIVGSIRYVTQAFIATGMGWMDAEADIEKLRPDIYAVNEDGDKPEKRAFCQQRGIEYRVLKREPRAGLPRRASTALRGF